MKKVYQELWNVFKKSNAKRREVIAAEWGKGSAEELKTFLMKELGLTEADITTRTRKPKADKTPAPVEPVAAVPVEPTPAVRHTVHNVYILDVSGSMSSGNRLSTALKGINAEITELKQDDTVDYTQSIITFSDADDIRVDHLRIPIKNMGYFTSRTRGLTALYDAIGHTFQNFENNVKDGEKVLIKIFTDGGENASRTYGSKEISDWKERLEAKGYTIAFVGTKADVEAVQANIKIHASNTLVHNNTQESVMRSFTASTAATKEYSKKLNAGEAVTDGFYSKKVGEL